MNKTTLREGDKIFSNGVFLKAMKITINGIEQIRWIVTSFEDTSFFNGSEINVYTYADSAPKLLIEEEE